MDIQFNNYESEERSIYKSPSCELPKLTISESANSTRYESNQRNSNRKNKKVSFNKNVSVVNIQSHKKYLRGQYNKKAYFEEDFNDNNQNCVNCNIF